MGDFLDTLKDADLNVRRVALVTFNSAAHNKPSLVRDLLSHVLPYLYAETKVRVSGRSFFIPGCRGLWGCRLIFFGVDSEFVTFNSAAHNNKRIMILDILE